MHDDEIRALREDVDRLEREMYFLRSAVMDSASLSIAVLTAAVSTTDERRTKAIETVEKRLNRLMTTMGVDREIGERPAGFGEPQDE